MVRVVLYLLLTVLLITLLRSFIGILMRMAARLLEPGPKPGARPAEVGGELKQDPICGVYVPTATSVKIRENGREIYFCSPECRDRYRRGASRSTPS